MSRTSNLRAAMFSGIVQAIGRIESVTPLAQGVRLALDVGDLPIEDIALGDSICVQGCCLTVAARTGRLLEFDVSAETLACTTGLAETGAVNLEKSLALGERVGGHLVSGHVDGVAEVSVWERAGESYRLGLRAPPSLARYIARKGSICVDGVSLTVNRVADAEFEVNLIPHTVAVTTLGRLASGAMVNLEVDPIARYVERMLARG